MAILGAKPLTVPSLVDSLHRALREEIFTGQLTAGEALTELAVTDRYKVARPTAKAAVERLIQDGLLRRSANKAARVPVLSIADVQDLYWTRSCLERELVGALALRRKVPPSAHRFVREMRDCIDGAHLSGVVEADVGFHRALVSELDSPRLAQIYDSLMGEVHLCMAQVQAHSLLRAAVIVEEHIAIITAVEAGDRAEAVAQVDQHLDRACKRLLDYLATEGTTATSKRGEMLPS